MTRRTWQRPIRWGILGCGAVTEHKSGPAFQKADGSALTAVMRRNGSLAEDYARRHGVPAWYTDAGALIEDPRVDAVYVATPPGTHLEYALRVCEAGKPAYVEKPMARNHAECLRMGEAFDKAGLPLYVAYYRRRLPRFLAVGQLLQARALGTVTGILSRLCTPPHPPAEGGSTGWRRLAEHSGGGLALDLGSHILDTLDFLFGPLEQVHGNAANRLRAATVEDTVSFCFRAGGVPGAGCWNFAAAIDEDLLEISGTEGRISLAVFGDGPATLSTAEGVRELPAANPEHVQQPLIDSVVHDLLGTDRCPSTGESAARTSRVLDTILEGYYGGRSDEFWKRGDTWPGLT